MVAENSRSNPDVGRATRRKPTNVSLPADLVEEARALGINLSETAERALVAAVRNAKGRDWLRRNVAAIEDYNERVARVGLFNAGLRRF